MKGRAVSKGDLLSPGVVADQDAVYVSLRDAETKDKSVFAATFSRDANGHSVCEVEYDEKNSNFHLAFDHAEILARAIGQCPAVVNPIQNPIERAPEVQDEDKNRIATSTDHL